MRKDSRRSSSPTGLLNKGQRELVEVKAKASEISRNQDARKGLLLRHLTQTKRTTMIGTLIQTKMTSTLMEATVTALETQMSMVKKTISTTKVVNAV